MIEEIIKKIDTENLNEEEKKKLLSDIDDHVGDLIIEVFISRLPENKISDFKKELTSTNTDIKSIFEKYSKLIPDLSIYIEDAILNFAIRWQTLNKILS